MTFPVFASGDVLNASDMNAVGLWLVKSQTIGTTVSSVTVTGAFSADYDNYKIIVSGGAASTTAGLDLKLGATATGYYNVYIFSGYGTSTVAASNGNNAVLWAGLGATTANGHQMNIDLLNPFAAKNTTFSGALQNQTTNAGAITGFLNNTTSYTEFTISTSTGTMTGGTIHVYGYRR